MTLVPWLELGPLTTLKTTDAPTAGPPLVVTVAWIVSARPTTLVISMGISVQSTTTGAQYVDCKTPVRARAYQFGR